jgi:hypothetical protein
MAAFLEVAQELAAVCLFICGKRRNDSGSKTLGFCLASSQRSANAGSEPERSDYTSQFHAEIIVVQKRSEQ